ncbi:hypothetical protein [Natrinema hispanicum]|uniref:Uncharacterized protein n=1 Tax=Natrinema hispanicum TaxID=392421 RepID=A0A1G6IHQ0_9EURY|nr:hypothetical protein [Natrinema hispanicum]SDC05984.1 hypothetical protein SAMN05192552_1001266 [Natrinema hispanicum]
MIEVTDREKSIGACALAVGLVVGLWAGLWLLPVEALDVPTDVQETSTGTVERAVYLPVPRSFFGVTIAGMAIAAWYSYTRLRDEPSEATEEEVRNAVSDGGTDR